jgi:hypothetical protein
MTAKEIFQKESKKVEEISTQLSRFIVPLFIDGGGKKPMLCGTGLLVSASTSSFLISAAHVFDELKDGNEIFFYIEPKTKLKPSGRILLTKIPEGKSRKQDILDIGVLKFEGPHQPPYPAVDKYTMSVDAFLSNALPREGKTYLLVGFPGSKSPVNPIKREVKSKVYGYRNISYPANKYSDFGVKPESHISIIFDRKRSIGPDGNLRSFPDPRGMSGSPVWLLKSEEEEPNKPNPISVVGVFIEYRKNQRVLLATDIGLALAMINDAICLPGSVKN